MAYQLKAVLTDRLYSTTEAEDAFCTWWDKTKQFATAGLLLVGKIPACKKYKKKMHHNKNIISMFVVDILNLAYYFSVSHGGISNYHVFQYSTCLRYLYRRSQ